LKGKGDIGDIGEVGGEFDDKVEEEYGGEEGGGGEGGGSARMGHVVGELSIEGHCQETRGRICPPPKRSRRMDAGRRDETHQSLHHEKCASDDQRGPNTDNPYAHELSPRKTHLTD
jgi:hypothetical protein